MPAEHRKCMVQNCNMGVLQKEKLVSSDLPMSTTQKIGHRDISLLLHRRKV